MEVQFKEFHSIPCQLQLTEDRKQYNKILTSVILDSSDVRKQVT